MVPFFALIGGFVVLRSLGLAGVEALDAWQPALRGGLALMLLFTAPPHFRPGWREDMIAMVPPSFPRPDLLVTATGILELAAAVGLLIPPLAPVAAICLAVLMLAMFPANISAARRKLTLGGRPVTPLPLRTLLQIVFVAAAIGAAV